MFGPYTICCIQHHGQDLFTEGGMFPEGEVQILTTSLLCNFHYEAFTDENSWS